MASNSNNGTKHLLRVAAEVKAGLSPVCATCSHYWNGRDNGAPGCGRVGCGGPVTGGSFPKYKGPMDDFRLAATCFMSGRDASFGVRAKGDVNGRMLGIHETMIASLAGMEGALPASPIILFAHDGQARLLQEVAAGIQATKDGQKTLGNLIKTNTRL